MEQTPEELAKAAAAEAVSILGGPVAAARKLNVEKYQTVQSWLRANGIPPKYCLRVSGMTGMTVQRLRPADWADYWPADLQVSAAH